MTSGATLTSLKITDRHRRLKNILLGFDTLDPYLEGAADGGATIGDTPIASRMRVSARTEWNIP
jgi:galactose mutarotase-like enzyme